MAGTTVNWLSWIGLVLLIAFDALVGIPYRLFLAIILVGVFYLLRELNKRLEKLESRSELNTLGEQLSDLNKRLRWVEHHLFGVDRDDMMSEEWSARQRVNPYEP